jgi:hypothetical protein
MSTENKRRAHHKKEELKANLSRLQVSLKAMVKGEKTFKNKSELSTELGKQLDLDSSLFRKGDSEHRKVLNQYLHALVPTSKVEVADVQVELKALRSAVAEKDRQILILKKILSEQPQTQSILPPEKGTDSYFYEYETTCMFVKDILDKNQNLKFINNELFDDATFSGDPEIVSENKKTKPYLRWERDRANSRNSLEHIDPDE